MAHASRTRNNAGVASPSSPKAGQEPILNFINYLTLILKRVYYKIPVEKSQTHRKVGTESHGSFSSLETAGLRGKSNAVFLSQFAGRPAPAANLPMPVTIPQRETAITGKLSFPA